MHGLYDIKNLEESRYDYHLNVVVVVNCVVQDHLWNLRVTYLGLNPRFIVLSDAATGTLTERFESSPQAPAAAHLVCFSIILPYTPGIHPSSLTD
jgi:hypothetical protein